MDEYKQELSSYEKGKKSEIRKSYWDSKGESIIDRILRAICTDYDLGRMMYIRVLPHQPIDNYVKMTNIKAVDNRNHWMRFDFIFEETSSHTILLVVELDGFYHEEKEQKERDAYKDGVCAALNIMPVRIKYREIKDINNENDVRAQYEGEIVKNLLKSYFASSYYFGFEKNWEQQKSMGEEKYKDLCNRYDEEIRNCEKKDKKRKYEKLRKYLEEAYYEYVPTTRMKKC